MKKKQRAKEHGRKVGGIRVRRRWADPPPREGRLHCAVPAQGCLPENWVFSHLLKAALRCALSLLTPWSTLHGS